MTRRRSISASSRDHHHHNLHRLHENNEDEDDNMSDNSSETLSTVPKEKRDDLVNPYWIEDPDMKKGEVEYLSSSEIQFWKDLLDKYLYPIDENKSEQVSFYTSTLPSITTAYFKTCITSVLKFLVS